MLHPPTFLVLAMEMCFPVTPLVVVLFLLPYGLGGSNSIVTDGYYPYERDGLIQLRDVVNSTINLHSKWTGPPCINNVSKWVGINCSNSRVVGLVLEGIQLTGSLPSNFLQNITYLTRLSFRNNSISGQLPNLTNLVHLKDVLLSSNRFSGSIPFEYSKLPRLRLLELEENHLNGEVPPFDQITLESFNISFNQLAGPIPQTGVLQKFPKSCYDHNLDLCGDPLELCPVAPTPASMPPTHPPLSPLPQRGKRKELKLWNIVLIAAAAALVPFLVVFFFLCYYKKAHRKETKKEKPRGASSVELSDKITTHSYSTDDPERTVELEFLDGSTPIFDLDDLLRASAEVLGKGTLGTTYRAALEYGNSLAVKRVKDMNTLTKKDFIQQMQLLGKMRHENLTKIIAFYYSKEEKLVIFEYVHTGNLFDLLHENRGLGREPLNWAARLSIIKDIAKGLAFLHQYLPSHKVPHANLKSSNVLIHQDGEAFHSKLTDYGFLPLLAQDRSSQKIAVCRSPEFCKAKKLTHKADVYCFGIVLLEVVTGRIPDSVSSGNKKRGEDLSDWVREVVTQNWSTDILDVEILAAREGHNVMLSLTELALQCTDEAPERRPKMSDVLRRIEDIELTHSLN